MALLYSLTLGHAPDEHLSRHFDLNSKVLDARTLGIGPNKVPRNPNKVPRNQLPPCNLVPPKW